MGGRGTISDSILGGHKTLFLTKSLYIFLYIFCAHGALRQRSGMRKSLQERP